LALTLGQGSHFLEVIDEDGNRERVNFSIEVKENWGQVLK
jgi:hypothetical protein